MQWWCQVFFAQWVPLAGSPTINMWAGGNRAKIFSSPDLDQSYRRLWLMLGGSQPADPPHHWQNGLMLQVYKHHQDATKSVTTGMSSNTFVGICECLRQHHTISSMQLDEIWNNVCRNLSHSAWSCVNSYFKNCKTFLHLLLDLAAVRYLTTPTNRSGLRFRYVNNTCSLEQDSNTLDFCFCWNAMRAKKHGNEAKTD